MPNIYTPVDHHSMAISNPAFWFLLVSEPQKPIKTNKNRETWKPRSYFPETSHVYMFEKPEKPMDTLET